MCRFDDRTRQRCNCSSHSRLEDSEDCWPSCEVRSQGEEQEEEAAAKLFTDLYRKCTQFAKLIIYSKKTETTFEFLMLVLLLAGTTLWLRVVVRALSLTFQTTPTPTTTKASAGAQRAVRTSAYSSEFAEAFRPLVGQILVSTSCWALSVTHLDEGDLV